MTAARALLAIETAGSACSVAIFRGPVAAATERRALRHGHAEQLLPMIDRVVHEAGLAAAELDAVAAAVGPGGFTGIRVGLAAAHGIALAARARAVGVTGFAAVAEAFAGDADDDRALLVALDSRREDLYVQMFAAATGVPLAPPQSVLPDRLPDFVAAGIGARPLLVAGDAAATAAQALLGRSAVAVAADSAPDACGVGAAALRRLRCGDLPPLCPLYLWPPDVSWPRHPPPAVAFP